jgi:hypothetical protein
MQSPRNPTRRNRNIGTAVQGHGSNNSLTIPDPRSPSGPYWTKLGAYTAFSRHCSGQQLSILVEAARTDCVHACSVADIVALLNLLPSHDTSPLAGVVLRQPKRKEQILSPVWGRIAYGATVGRHPEGTVSGPIVFLDATRPGAIWRHSKHLNPIDIAELERLERDGHRLKSTRSHIRVESSLEAIRATQLFHTIPHEIGHLVGYTSRVPGIYDAGVTASAYLDREADYWRRPPREREEFANRYADEFRSRMIRSGVIPFPRLEDEIQ